MTVEGMHRHQLYATGIAVHFMIFLPLIFLQRLKVMLMEIFKDIFPLYIFLIQIWDIKGRFVYYPYHIISAIWALEEINEVILVQIIRNYQNNINKI